MHHGFVKVCCLLPLVLLLTACPEERKLWVIPGSTRAHLVIGNADKREATRSRHWNHLTILSCADYLAVTSRIVDAHWSLTPVGDSRDRLPAPSRIRYGVVPQGYKASGPAKPLDTGCYVAQVSQPFYFVIDSSGAVRDITPGEAAAVLRADSIRRTLEFEAWRKQDSIARAQR